MVLDHHDITHARSLTRQNPVYWLIVVCGLLLIEGMFIGTAMTIDGFHERALNSRKHKLEDTVLLLARHFDQQIGNFKIIRDEFVTQLGRAGIASPDIFRHQASGENIHLMLKAKVDGFSDVGDINVFDSDGMLLNSSSVSPLRADSVADRAYFKAFKSGSAPTPILIETVQSRLSEGWVTVIAQKIVGPNGEFLGVMTSAIPPANVDRFFASVAPAENAAISVFHRDGTLLMRYPRVERIVGRNFTAHPLFQDILSKADQGTTRFISPINGEDRLVSVRTLTDVPIAVAASIMVPVALADWRTQTWVVIGAASLFTLVIALILVLIIRQVSRQHDASRRRLALDKHRLDTAINHMSQGLLLFDSSHRLVLFNQRYVEMFGLSPDVVKPGCTARDLLVHRKETGSFAGDVDEYYASVVRDMSQGNAKIILTSDGRSIQVTNQPLLDGGWVATLEDITKRQKSEAEITRLAHYDALTDLPNRVLFRERFERAFRRTHRGDQFALLYIDIDEFKSINDSLGHQIGDELLKAVASRLRDSVEETDFVARVGGDEFAIIQTAVKHPTDVTDLVTRIYRAIREPYEFLGHQLTTDASIGIAVAPHDGKTPDQLLRNADLAMYDAKADGRRTHRFFEPGMDARAQVRRELETSLLEAIRDGGFEVHYQPLLNLQTNKISGCEALLRWRHPERGMISPAEFIPVAEETGLINQLGEWVLTAACTEAATWPDHVAVAINVSPVQFRNHTFALKVAGALAASGLSARRLELEITEAVLIRDDEAALNALHQLRAMGVRIALDDFGTGYSSLGYLQRFHFDKIKIDRCFVNDIAKPDGSLPIVQAVVNIARARNMTTTAEGVETEQQLQLLRTLGCTEIQGYLFSAARPAADIKQLLLSLREWHAAGPDQPTAVAGF